METPSHRSSLLRRGDEHADSDIQPGHETNAGEFPLISRSSEPPDRITAHRHSGKCTSALQLMYSSSEPDGSVLFCSALGFQSRRGRFLVVSTFIHRKKRNTTLFRAAFTASACVCAGSLLVQMITGTAGGSARRQQQTSARWRGGGDGGGQR